MSQTINTNNYISISEAYNKVSGVEGSVTTLRGLTVLGINAGFIVSVETNFLKYNKLFCNKKKLGEYLVFIKTHYTTKQIADKAGLTPGGINIRFSQLNIKGVTKYGKKYYTKKDGNKIIGYCKKHKRGNKKTSN